MSYSLHAADSEPVCVLVVVSAAILLVPRLLSLLFADFFRLLYLSTSLSCIPDVLTNFRKKQVFRRVFQLDAELHHPQGPQAPEPTGDARLPHQDHGLWRGYRKGRRPALHPGKLLLLLFALEVYDFFVVAVAVAVLDTGLSLDVTVLCTF